MSNIATIHKQVKKNVSYGAEESERYAKKEKYLMKRFRWNYSQLHKNLVDDKFNMIVP